jgi:archaellum component FlaF (FlaF/FlaG flagellin family)
MGQSTVIATAFTAIIFVAGISIFALSMVSGFGTFSEAITNQAQIQAVSLNERIEFGDWTFEGSSSLRINVTNIGGTSIMVKDFDHMDLIVSYNDGSSDQNEWLTYDQTETADSYWSINRVFFRNQNSDLINPIKLSGDIRGGWDPDETLELYIDLNAVINSFDYLTLVTPAGVQAHSSLTKDYECGVSTVLVGTRIVTVTHELDRTPINVQVTPGTDIRTEYWVDQVGSESFEINLANKPTTDVLFYWRIE